MNLDSILADAGGANRMVLRTLALGSTATIIGATAFRHVVIKSANRDRIVTGEVNPLIARIGMFAAAALTIAAPWRILGQADAFMSPGDDFIPVLGLVLQTAWGAAAAVQVVAAIAALIGFYYGSAGELWGGTLSTAAAGALAITPAWMGHAAATQSTPIIAMTADVLHVGAAGSWAGSVIVLAIVLRRLSRQATGGKLAAELITRFRRLALTAAGVLLVTGVTASLFRLNSPADLVTSPYGVMLLIKLGLIACVAALGRRHSMVAATRARAEGARSVTFSIGAEAMLFVLIIAISALLSASPPPGE